MGDNLNDIIELCFCYDCDIRFRARKSFVELKVTTRGGKWIEFNLTREHFRELSEVKFAVFMMLYRLGKISEQPILDRRFRNNEPLN